MKGHAAFEANASIRWNEEQDRIDDQLLRHEETIDMMLEEFVKEHGLTNQDYLGDGAYAGVDSIGRVWIYTSDGITATNVVCLELPVLLAFMDWTKKLRITLCNTKTPPKPSAAT